MRIPRCAKCSHHLNLLRPDCAFLHEPRGEALELMLREDLPRADLLLVLGASLEVEPLKSVPRSLPHDVPRLYVAASPPAPAEADSKSDAPEHAWDVELIGDCDVSARRVAPRCASPRASPRASLRSRCRLGDALSRRTLPDALTPLSLSPIPRHRAADRAIPVQGP